MVYLNDCQPSEDPEIVQPYAIDGENAKRCWIMSEEMIGEKLSSRFWWQKCQEVAERWSNFLSVFCGCVAYSG